MRKGIYIASKTKHAEHWRKARAAGYHITSTWIDEAGAGESPSYESLAIRCIEEAVNAERVVLYCQPGDLLKGALIEAGAALAAGVPVFAVGDCDSLSRVFEAHPLWLRCRDLHEAFNYELPAGLQGKQAGAQSPADTDTTRGDRSGDE